MEKIVMNVMGMSCSHCEKAVTKALKEIDGVADVRIDLAGKTVAVDYDAGKASPDQFKTAIEDAGYDVV